MAFTASQKPILAEILQVSPEALTDLLSSLTFTAEQESWIVDDIDLWEANRNDVDIEIEGQVNLKTRWLLNAIRSRMRKAFGLPLFSFETSGASYSLAVTGIF